VWNLADGSCRAVLEGHAGRLNQVALSEDGGTALTASDDGTARLWSIPAGDCLQVALPAAGFRLQSFCTHCSQSPTEMQLSLGPRECMSPRLDAPACCRC
jgi:WD40 repeat protein